MKRLILLFCLLASPAWADSTTYFFPQAATSISTNITTPVTHTMAVTGIRAVRIVGSTAIWVDMEAGVALGATSSSTTSMFLPANVPEYFSAYQGINISVIADSASGTVYIVEMTP